MFYFCHSKSPLKIMKSKCVIRKRNLYLLDVVKNDQILSSEVCNFQYDRKLLFNREMGNIRSCKEIKLEKLIKFMLIR